MLLTGQVGLVVGESDLFWPRVIRWATKRVAGDVPLDRVPYHVVVADSESTYIGAEPGGVVRRDMNDAAYPEIAWSKFEDLDVRVSLRWLAAQLTAPYSYVDDVIVGLDVLLPVNFPRFVYGALINGRSWQCASLADEYLEYSGKNLFGHKPEGDVTPAHYFPFWRSKGWL